MIKILIPEDIPSSNKGEAALFEGIYNSLKVWDAFELNLFSIHPDEDQVAYGNRVRIVDARGLIPGHMLDASGSLSRKLLNYVKFILLHSFFIALWCCIRKKAWYVFRRYLWRSYIESDIILMCHDSFYAPLYHGFLLLMFKILLKPVVLYGSTIQPPDPKKSKLFIAVRNFLNRVLLRHARLISARENLSYNYLKRLGIENKECRIESYPDFAFLGSAASDGEVAKIMKEEGIPDDRLLVGIAISQRELEHAFPELKDISERRERALQAVTAVVDHITGTLEATVIFVPHSIGSTPKLDDRIVADWIYERAINKKKIIIVRNDYTASQLKGLAGRLHMTIGSRLHFNIDAVSMRVPSILITHKGEFRCHGIIGDMVGQKKYVFNIDDIRTDELISLLNDLWQNHDAVRQDLNDRMPLIEQRILQHAKSAKEIYQLYSS